MLRQRNELAPIKSRLSDRMRFTRGLDEVPPWLASCMTENPTPAMAKPTERLSSTACQGRRWAKSKSPYDPASHASIAMPFKPIRTPPWRERAERSK